MSPTAFCHAACAALLALLAGCGGAVGAQRPTGELLVVVELPRGALDAAAPTFRDPYPSGARLVARELDRPQAPPRLLSGDFDAAGAPCADAAGERLLFVGRREPGASWRVWELALAGGEPRALSPEGANAVSACWLPDGRVVYSSDLEGTLDPFDGGPAFSLYVTARGDAAPARLSFDPSSEVDPTVLADGRILYAVRQAAGPDRSEASWAFLTIANDGTGVSGFCGSHAGPLAKHRARQVGERLAYLAGERGAAAEELVAVPMRRPLSAPDALASRAGATWRSADDLDGSRLLVSHRPPASPDQPASFGLSALDPRTGELETLVDDPALDEVDAVLARRRRPPRDKLSLVDPAQQTGELLILDARLSDRAWTIEPGAGPSVALEVLRALPRRARPGAAFELGSEVLARVPLAADGSAFLEVPADTPLRLRTLDEDGATVLDSNGWVWVRPAEKRGCIGCHEDRERAPANRFPQALAGDDPRPFVVGTREVAER